MFSRPALSRAALVGAALASATACGGDDGSGPDGGSELSSLEVLTPPGDEIGLPFYGEVTLRVKYSDASGAPVPGAALAFELIASASEATGDRKSTRLNSSHRL